ncbi:DNA methyltransferase [Planctomycetaceae bacterium SH139]
MASTNKNKQLADGPLDSGLRKQLERMVVQARRVAIAGAREAIEALTVDQGKRGAHVTSEPQISLRNRLRAHGRFLGDRQNSQSGQQTIDRLVEECAYQHWHRMLFARFLAENELLIDPESGMSLAMQGVDDLARDLEENVWDLAGQYAQTQLPAIFRDDNPVLDVELSPDCKKQLREFVQEPSNANSKLGLPAEVFEASDSLGWVYQFWQNEENERANKSEDKIDSSTLPAVTQFFTEDYMVMFLLHNTMGAWHAGKVLAANPSLAESAEDEDELRRAVSLSEGGGYEFEYLRFVREPAALATGSDDEVAAENTGPWRPMGGTFDGWPASAAKLKVIDPCCGSGHFLVAAMELLVRLRMHEEGLDLQAAIDVVLEDNLFGLELDKRCTQIAVFNLALAAWKLDGKTYRKLPSMTIAHVGQSISATKPQWMELLKEARGEDENNDSLGFYWGQLYDMYSQASTLGSLINPRRFLGSHQLNDSQMQELFNLLETAVAADPNTEAESHELQLAAKGLATATKLLGDQYHLVLTNVPYLGQKKQSKILRKHIETFYVLGKGDLATAFVLRCLEFCEERSTTAFVAPQNWMFLGTYSLMRAQLLESREWRIVARLGPRAFDTISGEVVNVGLVCLTNSIPDNDFLLYGTDASDGRNAEAKRNCLLTNELLVTPQSNSAANENHTISLESLHFGKPLRVFASAPRGIVAGDKDFWVRQFWEMQTCGERWRFLQGPVNKTTHFGGRESVIDWSTEGDGMLRPGLANTSYGRQGVAVSQIGDLPSSLYSGDLYDNSLFAIVPEDESKLLAIWAFCSSDAYAELVRKVNQKLSVDPSHLISVPFEFDHWDLVGRNKYPDGLPEPESDDPTQWLFHGWPSESTSPLHVAVARLLGYRWPAELDSEMRLSDQARELVGRCSHLGSHTDDDGIVCIPPVRGEDIAADRLASLLNAAGVKTDENLEDWLRNRFFKEHCELFDHRPFVWHIWDGRKQDGFHALVNYHQLAGPRGHKLLERLTYSYLGDWIERREDEVRRDVAGAEARLLAARELRERLEAILTGQPPYDIFVRWKPIHEQPIGWNPDINDGVRINIRPFMAVDIPGGQKGAGILRVAPKRMKWGKDRGKEPKRPIDEYPWFWSWDQTTEDFAGGDKFDGLRWNDCHYTNQFKQAARDSAKETSE